MSGNLELKFMILKVKTSSLSAILGRLGGK